MRHIRNSLILKIMMIENDKPSENRSVRPLSPCQLICTLDDEQRCLGCGRTLVQISSWVSMSVEEQWQIIDQLDARSDENGATIVLEKGD